MKRITENYTFEVPMNGRMAHLGPVIEKTCAASQTPLETLKTRQLNQLFSSDFSQQLYILWLFIVYLHCCRPDQAVWPYKKPKQLQPRWRSAVVLCLCVCLFVLLFDFIDSWFGSRSGAGNWIPNLTSIVLITQRNCELISKDWRLNFCYRLFDSSVETSCCPDGT